MECKIGIMGKLTQCLEYNDGECLDIDKCIYKDPPLKEKYNLIRYVIVAKNLDTDDEKYLDNEGYLGDIKYADFYTDKNEAERVRKFVLDEPEKFEVCEVEIELKVSTV